MKRSRRLQIFLLYARQDEAAVRRLYRWLLRTGADVWLDSEKLVPGQDWVYEIHRALHTSDLIIACLSEQFNQQGGYRHEELRLALEKAERLPRGRLLLVPARLEPCDAPEPLGRWQRVDLFERNGYGDLTRTLQAAAELSRATEEHRVRSPAGPGKGQRPTGRA